MSAEQLNVHCSYQAMNQLAARSKVEPGTQEICPFALGKKCGLTVVAETGLKYLVDYPDPVSAVFVRRYDQANERQNSCPHEQLLG